MSLTPEDAKQLIWELNDARQRFYEAEEEIEIIEATFKEEGWDEEEISIGRKWTAEELAEFAERHRQQDEARRQYDEEQARKQND